MLCRDPTPGVGDVQFDELSLLRRANHQFTPLGHRIFGVAHHIQKHLLQLIRGDQDQRQSWFEDDFEGDLFFTESLFQQRFETRG